VRVLGHQSVAEHAGVHIYIPWEDMSSAKLLDLLNINSFIQWSSQNEFTVLCLNGRQLVELLENCAPFDYEDNEFIWDILLECVKIFPSILDIKGSKENHTATHDAHATNNELTMATYYVKGISRIIETQWVRHRSMSYTVQSGRYNDYANKDIIRPSKWSVSSLLERFSMCVSRARSTYLTATRDNKIPRQDARYILPQGLATEMAVTATLRWWNHFFKTRSAKQAQWEIRSFSKAIQRDLRKKYPELIRLPPDPLDDEVEVKLNECVK
jgi:flavin-dependent thymidylate synthase